MFSFNDDDILRQLNKSGSQGYGMIERSNPVRVWFYMHAIKDDVASAREKRPIYKDAPYAARRVEGDVDFISSPVTPELVGKHGAEWQLFQDWLANPQIPVRMLPGLNPSAHKYCEDAKIYTISQLAEATELVPELEAHKLMAQKWMGLREPAKKTGRPKGSKNKVKEHVKDAKAAA